MNPEHFILKDKEPVEVDLLTWARWFKDIKLRRVAEDMVGGKRVSTVFLGIDYNFGNDGPPLLFETMIFSSKTEYSEEFCARYATWTEAETGHKAAVALAAI